MERYYKTKWNKNLEPAKFDGGDIRMIFDFVDQNCPNLSTILVFLETTERRDLSKFGKTKLSNNPKFAKIPNSVLGLRIQNLKNRVKDFKFYEKMQNYVTKNQEFRSHGGLL